GNASHGGPAAPSSRTEDRLLRSKIRPAPKPTGFLQRVRAALIPQYRREECPLVRVLVWIASLSPRLYRPGSSAPESPTPMCWHCLKLPPLFEWNALHVCRRAPTPRH